jgi:hypothetical protein
MFCPFWARESRGTKVLRPLRRPPRACLPLVRRQIGTGRKNPETSLIIRAGWCGGGRRQGDDRAGKGGVDHDDEHEPRQTCR